jgi:hypothetical protein
VGAGLGVLGEVGVDSVIGVGVFLADSVVSVGAGVFEIMIMGVDVGSFTGNKVAVAGSVFASSIVGVRVGPTATISVCVSVGARVGVVCI